MNREEIIEIEQYRPEHEVGKKAWLAELGIPFWNFYKARMIYRREDERNAAEMSAGQFIPLPARRCNRKTSRKFAEAVRKRRQEESYPVSSRRSQGWEGSVYTYALLPRLGRYDLDGRYHINNNGEENAIRPLVIGPLLRQP